MPETTGRSTVTEIVGLGPDERRVVRQFRLRVLDGPDKDTEFTSASERSVLGTHQKADFRLSDTTISRYHCEILLTESGAVVRDLASRNGTLLDGVSVRDADLHMGGVLLLGNTRIRFDLADSVVRLPLSERTSFGSLVGSSRVMREAFAVLERTNRGNLTVLLGGETGTGKEVAARSLHEESNRANGPFIVVDCGAIPPSLFESEVFGHERGAFTGADDTHVGAFEDANGGTLFLDEIGELHQELQPKLLRVLERREIMRVGATRPIPVDVRVVAATNRDLRAEVVAGKFRADLFYRIAVVEVALPALRERMEDLPVLVKTLLDTIDRAPSPEAEELTSRTFLLELSRHNWPGNVRELRNHLERCLALGESATLVSAHTDTPPAVNPNEPWKLARERWICWFERRYLELGLEKASGNTSAAARAAKIDRKHFYRLLWKHNLR